MFYFKGCFKAMEDACILDMNDPFESHSLQYISQILQICVEDQYVTIWNRHKVRRINECGHFSDNHVLELDIFKSLNNFEGGGVILMACILVFHMTR